MTRTPPAHPATARGLIEDHHGRWLLVRPVNTTRWYLPGGLIEQDEPPATACAREVREEIGVPLPTGRLLVLGWNAPTRPTSRARFIFLFSMGTHDADTLSAQIQLQATELTTWRWATPDTARCLLHPQTAERLTRQALINRGVSYIES